MHQLSGVGGQCRLAADRGGFTAQGSGIGDAGPPWTDSQLRYTTHEPCRRGKLDTRPESG